MLWDSSHCMSQKRIDGPVENDLIQNTLLDVNRLAQFKIGEQASFRSNTKTHQMGVSDSCIGWTCMGLHKQQRDLIGPLVKLQLD